MAEADALWAAPHVRRADVLDPDERDEARVAAELRPAAGELRGLAALDPALLGGPEDVLETLAAVEVRQGDATEGVLLADPLEIRARRFRAVFVCGLQDAEFPQRPVPEPFLDDDARRGLAAASGLRLPLHEDVLDRERSLFYACVSRPQEVLFLSWRSSDEEGEPLVASPFLDDVRTLFTDQLWAERGRRLLAEVTWSPREAPTPRELRRAQAAARSEPDPPGLAAPVSAPVLAQLAARRTEGARQLETFAACGVRWLVEGLLAPRRVTPDPDAMKRGSRAHAVLEATLRGLKANTGSARLTPATPARRAGGAGGGAGEGRPRADRRPRPGRAAHARGRPEALPAPRGRERGGARAGVARVALRPRRRRARPARARARRARGHRAASTASTSAAAGRSCATTRARARRKGAGWAEGGALQVALYMLAARELLGLQPVGGLYQPLWSKDSRPRGLVRDDVAGRYVKNDVVDEPGLEEALGEIRERALSTAEALRGGRDRAVRGEVLARRLRVPDDLQGGRMTAAVKIRPGGVAFTAEQRAAIDDRTGSALLAANAGSGKTAVMAERCVEAVLNDEVPVGSILALTFTEKAAGELRDRIRRRFISLGEEEHARAVDAGWIGTIHGFCARILRARPLAAGLDPRFEVLDEPAAERLAGRGVRARVRGVGARARGAGDRRRRRVRRRSCARWCCARTRRCARAARRGRSCACRRPGRRRTPPRWPRPTRPRRATS